ncbi:hypothetical protein [Streptomyces graminilatus]|uniref:hypothetical protein n=1 Tax=Streptomyces graminilatus TaxID=1464070 RepID=UPI0012FEE3A2|nr:hypothetical protein [Streptomyces graminilatus]
MSKKLNTDDIASELRGSVFFPKEPALKGPPATINQPTARPGDETAARATDRPTGRRVLIRRGFEWGQDQLDTLKKLSLREQMEGNGDGSMSRIVREALDDYFKKRGL